MEHHIWGITLRERVLTAKMVLTRTIRLAVQEIIRPIRRRFALGIPVH